MARVKKRVCDVTGVNTRVDNFYNLDKTKLLKQFRLIMNFL